MRHAGVTGAGQAQQTDIAMEFGAKRAAAKQHGLDIHIPGAAGPMTVNKRQPVPEVDSVIARCWGM